MKRTVTARTKKPVISEKQFTEEMDHRNLKEDEPYYENRYTKKETESTTYD